MRDALWEVLHGGEGKAAAKGSSRQEVNGDSLVHEWMAPAGEGSEVQAHSTIILDSMPMSWS